MENIFTQLRQLYAGCTGLAIIISCLGLLGLISYTAEVRTKEKSDNLTVSQFNTWKEATPDIEWIPNQSILEDIRAVKAIAEIETLRHAVKVTDYAFSRALQSLKPGMSEKDYQWALKQALFDIDGREESFEIIVAAGKNSAKPHARASDEPIPTGVPIVIDMGALVDGYHADMKEHYGTPDSYFTIGTQRDNVKARTLYESLGLKRWEVSTRVFYPKD